MGHFLCTHSPCSRTRDDQGIRIGLPLSDEHIRQQHQLSQTGCLLML